MARVHFIGGRPLWRYKPEAGRQVRGKALYIKASQNNYVKRLFVTLITGW